MQEKDNITLSEFINGIHKIEIKDDKVFLFTTQQIVGLIENNIEIMQFEFNIHYKKKKLEYNIINE